MKDTQQQQPTYSVKMGTAHLYIMDQDGNYIAKSFDTTRENFDAMKALTAAANQAAALTAAREALELIVDAMKGRVHSTPALAAVEAARAALQQLNGEAQP